MLFAKHRRKGCPAAAFFDPGRDPLDRFSGCPCDICTSFVGLDVPDKCPCHQLGNDMAVERSTSKLTRLGYLDEGWKNKEFICEER